MSRKVFLSLELEMFFCTKGGGGCAAGGGGGGSLFFFELGIFVWSF